MQSIQELTVIQRQGYWFNQHVIVHPNPVWNPLAKESVYPVLFHRRGEKDYYNFYVNNEEEAYEPGEDNLYP